MAVELSDAALQRVLNTTVTTRFANLFMQADAEVVYKGLVTEIPVVGRRLEMPYALTTGRMREWIGDRIVNAIATGNWSQTVRDFEWTLGIKRRDIDDDLIGLYRPVIDQMAQVAAREPDQLVADVLIAGESALQLGYDGKPLFATDHPVNPTEPAGTAFSNLITGRALTSANFEYGQTLLRRLVGPDGRVLGMRGRVLTVGPQLEATAHRIVDADMVVETPGDGAVTNMQKGKAKVVVVDRLDEVDSGLGWYLSDDTQPLRMILFGTRQAPRMVAITAETSDVVFSRREFQWGVDARWVAAPGLPQTAIKFRP
ncbi:MAG: major head subunit protein [Myxococcaceae bacterium]|nr:major head subunit protein [Myxococcaceae bacterium]